MKLHGRLSVFFLIATVLFTGVAPASPSAHPAGFPPGEFAARRARVLEALEREGGKEAFLLLRAPGPSTFAGDVEYPYRPDNDLYYLTGIPEPSCALLLSIREVEERGREVLFLGGRHPALRVWVGEGLTREAAREASGLPERALADLESLPEVLRKLGPLRRGGFHPGLAGPRGGDPEDGVFYFDERAGFRPGDMPGEPHLFLMKTFGSGAFHLRLRDPAGLIHPLRQVKSPAEVRCIEQAVRATVKALDDALHVVRPGIREYEVRAAIEAAFIREGCAGWGFPPIVASGPNTCVLHYPGYDRKVEAGDLVLLDIGAESVFYSADVTRTFPASGKFTPRQRDVYEVVLRAQEAAIRSIRPGVAFRKVNEVAAREIAHGLERLGIIPEGGDARKFLPHGASHGLGLAVHDPMPAGTLAAGMVITVEPGIYLAEEGLGVRIEDDVLVTEDGARVLSAAAPRAVEEIEARMAAREF